MRHAGAEDDYLEFQRAADRMNLTARQLMSVQQADIGQPELLDLNQIVAESHGMLARAIAQGLFLRLELGAVRGLRMAATRWDLERILLHLVRNASRTIATGGVVLIETLYMQQVPGGLRPPHIRARPYVRLIVSNSGMPSAAAAGAVPHLSPSHQDGGDLGLSTVWRLVTQMNGVLQFDGDAESRTRIRVDFPLASDD
jgi:signal transduction histidine kinase